MVSSRAASATPKRKAGALGCLIIAALIMLIILIVGCFTLYPTWNDRLNGIQTQGTVTNVVMCHLDRDDTVIRPYLAQDNGANVEAEIVFTDQQGHKQDVWENNCDTFTLGQTVTLWYLPTNPQMFATDQQLTDTYIVVGVLSIFGVPSALVLLIALLRLLLFVPLLFHLRRA